MARKKKKAKEEARVPSTSETIRRHLEMISIQRGQGESKRFLGLGREIKHYLESDTPYLCAEAAKSLADVAAWGLDISPIFPALMELFSDPDVKVRYYAVRAFWNAKLHAGVDISSAVPTLVNLLSDEEDSVRTNAVGALASVKDHPLVVGKVMELTQSEWFQKEMAANSPVYMRTVSAIADLFDDMKISDESRERRVKIFDKKD